MEEEEKNPANLQSVTNALKVLKLFKASESKLGVSQISRRMGIGKSSAFRLVSTLLSEGFLGQDPVDAKYYLGSELLHLGHLVHGRIDLVKDAHPYLEQLCAAIGQTVHLSLLDQDQTMFIDKIQGSSIVHMSSSIGMRLPAYATASGKVLLSFKSEEALQVYLDKTPLTAFTAHTITDGDRLAQEIQQVRHQGYAVDREESEEYLTCIAVPLCGFGGRPQAALSASGVTGKMTAHKGRYLDELKKTAAAISRALGRAEEGAPVDS